MPDGAVSAAISGWSGAPLVGLAGPGVVVVGGGDGDAGGAGGLDVAVDGDGDVEADPATAGVVGLDGGDGAGHDHEVAGEHRALHAEGHAPESAGGAGPVGDEALEPGGLVRGVEEDVAGAVAVDREVVVVVH